MSIQNLSLICIPFTLDPLCVAIASRPGDGREVGGDAEPSLRVADEFDLRWAGVAAG
ncbi:MAG: hypothetical protein J0L88_03915 [Xanthomonadales bacterium]|nr:hypothetical protein [Xanthomonadales bacterium]